MNNISDMNKSELQVFYAPCLLALVPLANNQIFVA